jgi:hypothetical protein
MKNPIPFIYRLFRKYKGCIPNKPDSRDIVLGATAYTPDPNCPSWEQGFNNEVKYGTLKREHQGSSSSCVGQGWSKYLEMINLIEEKQVDDLSARDVYSQIFLPEGGAYIRDGAKVAVNKGVCEEGYLSSYIDGKPPTEPFMRLRSDIGTGYDSNRVLYQAKRFVYLETNKNLLTNEDWENIRQVIWQYGGFVSGYNRHCMYVSEYLIRNGKKTIKFINSYGNGSDIYYSEGDVYPLYDITFLVDMPNQTNMKQIILDTTTNKQYLVGDDGFYTWIYNEAVLEFLDSAGIVDKTIVIPQSNLDLTKVKETIALIK